MNLKIFIIPLLICLFIPVLAGNLTINLEDKGINYIAVNWSKASNITTVSFDGILVTDFDINGSSLIKTGLAPNTEHIIKIYNKSDNGQSIINTLDIEVTPTPITEKEQFFSSINLYILFFFALICIVVGFYIPVIGFGSVLFGILGIITSINNSFIMGLLFVIVTIAGFVIALEGMKT
jgi:hypothetical protein